MKIIVMAIGLLVSTVVFGNQLENHLAETNKSQRCAAWVTNAMHGATQSLRGVSRDVQYIQRSNIFEVLKNIEGVDRDKIYIMTDEGHTDDEREFLEKSTLFGYDEMSSWKSRHAGTLPARDEWRRQLTNICLAHGAI